jgi:phosphate transport system substrate-binding protein
MLRSVRFVRLAAPLLIAVTIIAACSSSSKSSSSSSSSSSGGGGTTLPPVTGTLNGSGSTLQQNYDNAAIAAFTQANPGATINYNGVGSGQGQSDLANKNTQFGGSDVAISSTNLPKFGGETVLYFPIVADPVTISYNLPSVSTLDLSGDTIAKIFSGSIKFWDDAAIAADNSGNKLPHTPITVVHRSDSSGTTGNFTKYLTKVGGADWKLGSATTVAWPASERAGKGSSGVATIVAQTTGAVGYIDFSDAKSVGTLQFAQVKNAAGALIAPSLDGVSAALSQAPIATNLTYDPINAAGATSYPITSPTYILVAPTQLNPGQSTLLKAFLTFILSSAGQQLATANNYAPLSPNLDQMATAQLSQIA